MAQPVKPILDPRENAYGYGKTPKANSGGFYREVGKNIANAFTGKKDPNGFDIRTRMQYNNYITNFVKDAIDAISIALQTGIINPNATEPTATATQTVPQQPTATATQTVPQQPTATATQTVPQKKQTAQPTSDYINKIAAAMNGTADQRKKIALAKNLINYMSSRKGTTDWNNALGATKQLFKKSNLDPNFANAAMSNLQSGSRMTESTYINLCTLLEKTNLSWKKLGLTILKEQRGFYVVDSTYYKMNTLFESVVSITEEIAKGLSISQYMTQWLGKELPRNALKDINLSPEQMQNLQQLIQQVQTTWGKDKGKAALTELAKEAWDISVSARNLRIASLSSRTHNSYNGMDVKKAIASLAQLKATRPADFNEIIHAVMNENKKDTK